MFCFGCLCRNSQSVYHQSINFNLAKKKKILYITNKIIDHYQSSSFKMEKFPVKNYWKVFRELSFVFWAKNIELFQFSFQINLIMIQWFSLFLNKFFSLKKRFSGFFSNQKTKFCGFLFSRKVSLMMMIIMTNLKPISLKKGKSFIHYFEKDGKKDIHFSLSLDSWI